MSRSRRLQRMASSASTSSSSSSTSPERDGIDDDADSFTLHSNDSASSLGLELSSDMARQNAAARLEYEMRCRVSPVARLPAELLISIFARLSAPSDLRNCMLVSKDWARNSVGLLWHRPGMGKWESIHSVVQSIRKADKFFAYQDLVKRLNMSTLAAQVSDGSLWGLEDCKRIERLTLTNCCKVTDISLQPLVDGNRSLLALDITGLDQVTDRTLLTVADNCLRLQGLNITACRKLTDASISAIAKACRHLKRLKFNGCSQLTDTSIMTVAAHSTHLLEIDLHGLSSVESPAITALLASCKHLREVRLAHCTSITDAAFTQLPNNNIGLPGSSAGRPLRLDALRILDLTDCTHLTDASIESLIPSSPRLRNLILAKCRLITDRSLLAITKLGKNLHYIHLGHCSRVTDYGVGALAGSCSRLRYVDLACCSLVSDEGVVRLAGLVKLKRVGLVKCGGVGERGILALANGGEGRGRGGRKSDRGVNGRGVERGEGGVSVLERVHLSYCTLLTLEGIHTLLNSCPKLTHLSLTGVQAFLRDELLVFCREAPPEFNDHQRDVFCVFSGSGVGRLRDYLNNEKVRAALELAGADSSAPPSVIGEPDEDGDDGMGGDGGVEMGDMEDSEGSNTPVISINAGHSLHRQDGGQTPVVATPGVGPSSGLLFSSQPAFQHHQRQDMPAWQRAIQHTSGPSSNNFGAALSSSAPAASGMWPSHALQQQPHFGAGVGGAQHVTGMMGAAALDDVDEEDGDGDGDGDEGIFGEGEGSDGLGD